MKEMRSESFQRVGDAEIQRYEKVTRRLLSPQDHPKYTGKDVHDTTYVKGDDIITVAYSRIDDKRHPVTTFLTPISTPTFIDNALEERTYAATLGDGVTDLKYDFDVRAVTPDGQMQPRFPHDKIGYEEEEKYGLHNVTKLEYKKLMETLRSLGPEDRIEREY